MTSQDPRRQDGGNRTLRRARLSILAAAALLGMAGCKAHIPDSTAMLGTATTVQPAAYTDLCGRHPQLCTLPEAEVQPAAIQLDEPTFAQLSAVNAQINRSITYGSDRDVFGRTEYWTVAETAGDCEDFALSKLQRLLELGFPRKAMRMAIARRRDGILHAVLAVDTTRGTYILDSSYDRIYPWDSLGYSEWRWEEPGKRTWRTAVSTDVAQLTSGQ